MTQLTAQPGVRQRTLAKARVLLDALPYIREHFDRTVVVKVGGAAMSEPRLSERFAEDIALLRMVGVKPVVVHGGGPQISALSERLGLTPEFRDGHRITDAETLEIAKMVLVGKLNKDLVVPINRAGVPAIGLSGDDGNLLMARKRIGAGGEDLGFVGDITSVNEELLARLMQTAVPVIASVATDGHGQSYNVNADLGAAAVAAAMRASKLVLLTDVPGVIQDDELVSELDVDDAESLIADGKVSGGMIPKLEAVVRAMHGGVGRAHVVDGRVEHALILELFTPEGMGTMITHPVKLPIPEAGELEGGARGSELGGLA
ncbi:MAG: acetylglutamate kinase [Actinomycetota bacterium]